VKYRTKSQLYSDAEAQQKGAKQILDDCTWSSCAAAVSWASGYSVDYSAADGVAAEKAALKRVDRQGVSDNGGSLPEAVKVIAHLGGKARYAKSWEDAVSAAKNGAALMVWVQQGVQYPAGVKISAWHDRWFKWWSKRAPEKIKAGYGHMTSAGYDREENVWYWTCPTRDEKVAAEKYGVIVTEAQLRQIANSKVAARKLPADYKALLIVTHPGARVVVAPQPVVAVEPARGVQLPAASTTAVPAPASPSVAQKSPVAAPSVTAAAEAELAKVDWADVASDAVAALSAAEQATRKEKGMKRIWAGLTYIVTNTKLDEMLLDLVRTFVTVSVSVALGLGIPLLDLQGGDFRVILSAGLASAAQVLVKALDSDNTSYGVTKPKP
jgi:hypothetical protein